MSANPADPTSEDEDYSAEEEEGEGFSWNEDEDGDELSDDSFDDNAIQELLPSGSFVFQDETDSVCSGYPDQLGERRETNMLSLVASRERHSKHQWRTRREVAGHTSLVQRLEHTKLLRNHTGCVNTLAWNDSGSLLLSGSDDLMLCLWDYNTGRLVQRISSRHTRNVFGAKFMPFTNDNEIVSGAADGKTAIRDRTRVAESTRIFHCNNGMVYRVVTNGSMNTWLTCSGDGTVRLYDKRVQHNCETSHQERRRLNSGECNNVLVDLAPRGTDDPLGINTIAVDNTRPWQFAIGCSDPITRVYDMRMLPDPSRSEGGDEVCVARFCPDDMIVNGAFRRNEVTGLAFHRNEILASFNSNAVYLFDLADSQSNLQKWMDAHDVAANGFCRRRRSNATETDASEGANTFERQERGFLGSRWESQRDFMNVLRMVMGSRNREEQRERSRAGIEDETESESPVEDTGIPDDDAASSSSEEAAAAAAAGPDEEIPTETDEKEPAACSDRAEGAGADNNNDGMGSDPEETSPNEGDTRSSSQTRLMFAHWKSRKRHATGGGTSRGGGSKGQDHIGICEDEDQKESPQEELLCPTTSSPVKKLKSSGDVLPSTSQSEVEERKDQILQALGQQRIDDEKYGEDLEAEIAREASMPEGIEDNEQESGDEEFADAQSEIESDSSDREGGGPNVRRQISDEIDAAIDERMEESDEDSSSDDEPVAEIEQVRVDSDGDDVPITTAWRQTFSGHLNAQTIKEVNFLGPSYEYVVSGSDDGRVYFWVKSTGNLCQVLNNADSRVCNCVCPHPFDTCLATSGIENHIKIWKATAMKRTFRSHRSKSIAARNKERMRFRGPMRREGRENVINEDIQRVLMQRVGTNDCRQM